MRIDVSSLSLFVLLGATACSTVVSAPGAQDAPAEVAQDGSSETDIGDGPVDVLTPPADIEDNDAAETTPDDVTEPPVDVTTPDAQDDVPDDTFVPQDGSCTPDCTEKVCGDDGCGGICGYCTYPLVCDAEGLCVEVCEPQCDEKLCGPDGCGGACSPGCDEALDCGEDGLCYEPACVPDCSDKVCGSDGCGGDCGLCAAPKVCQTGGCALGPCGTVDAVGECQGEVAVTCEGLVTLVEEDCAALDDQKCAYDAWSNQFTCMEIGPCEPQCTDKVCGSDGCDGTCGACTNGWACELGQCKPEPGGDCGPITATGLCEGSILIFCSAAKIYMVDCASTGETCKWDPPSNGFGCN